ncbi:MAG: hypothetical protein AW07_03316 [Candidatus Accumulibacter sp. SK-11]|nr:MAG: hypothetical protein AW07_03316 [Candidatus Accumulibacter sp. SK-11]
MPAHSPARSNRSQRRRQTLPMAACLRRDAFQAPGNVEECTQ